MITLCLLVKDPPPDRMAMLLDYVAPVVGQVVCVVDDRTDPRTQDVIRGFRKGAFVSHPTDVHALDKYFEQFGCVDVYVPYTWTDDFAAARNAALPYVKGEWVLHLDPDELPSADMLAFLSMVDRSEWRDSVEWKDGRYFDPRGYLFWTRNYFGGVQGEEWEEHWHCRLFRTALGKWYKPVHELVALQGQPESATRNTPLLPKAPRAAHIIHTPTPHDDSLYARIEARA